MRFDNEASGVATVTDSGLPCLVLQGFPIFCLLSVFWLPSTVWREGWMTRKRKRDFVLPSVPSDVASDNRHRRFRTLKQRRGRLEGPTEGCVVTSSYAYFTEEYVEFLKESYPGRSYYGPPEYECPYCGAVFWYRERTKGVPAHPNGQPAYNSCCKGGRFSVPRFRDPPPFLAALLKYDGDSRAKKFLRLNRQYNCLFAFTSIGARIDRDINDGRGPYVFRINGQVHHRIGSLLPADGEPPQFVELYIYDTDHEIDNRIRALDPSERIEADLDRDIIVGLLQMLDEHNPLVRSFRMARDRLRECDPVQYNLPTCEQLALLVVGDFSVDTYKRDIVVHCLDGNLQRISPLHPALMALQYPLLFPYGERGYQLGIYCDAAPTRRSRSSSRSNTRGSASRASGSRPRPVGQVKVTMQDYYRYWFHYRKNQPNPYLCYGRLSAQIKVDARACIDEDRLDWVVRNQAKLRCEHFQGIVDAVARGTVDADAIGKRTYLPASHTGGRRYMIQNYHDAIAICRVYGPCDIFLTYTCNPKWPEISEAIRFEPGQKSTDRSDIVVRVYHMKLEELLDDVKDGSIFGPINAVLHCIEFQKRGLPHAHLLIWLSMDTSQPSAELIDSFISAEIPDPEVDPLGYALVAEHMMHGPCGQFNPKAPCMKNGVCSKRFPKPFEDNTRIDDQGFAVYKRAKNGRYVKKGNANLDNGWVVPYNMALLKKFQAHINVEWCNKTHVLKYLFKYVTKGPDSAKVYLERIRRGQDAPVDPETRTINEVREYLDVRYICEHDACWRVLGFDIHSRMPAVERMPVHLPGENIVTYKETDRLPAIAANDFLARTMLTEWFVANQIYPAARNLTYCEYPTKMTWDESARSWHERAGSFKIGRLYYVHPSAGERFYLRMLLMVVKGATSYADLRTYQGRVYETFKEACAARGLLGDDNEWLIAFNEAAMWGTTSQLRSLFVTMLLFCDIKDEFSLFESVWLTLGDDIEYSMRQALHNPSYVVPSAELKDLVLDEISLLLSKHGVNIKDYNLPPKTLHTVFDFSNRLIDDEMSYDVDALDRNSRVLYEQLNPDQVRAYNEIVNCVTNNVPGFFFVSGYGGTGKTFLWNAIVSALRAQRKIVLTVASSGVAALLLPGGRTAHSRFKIPIDIDDRTVCDVKRGSMLAELIIKTSLVIWDEALMTHRKCFETLDRTFRDLMSVENPGASELVFGGKVIVLGGDLRQTLPVIEGGTRAEIVNASITNSPLWSYARVLSLNINMRMCSPSLDPALQSELADFSRWVLDLGDGKLPTHKVEGDDDDVWIDIPSDLLVYADGEKIPAITSAVYPDFELNFSNASYICDRAILTPTNDIADEVNAHVLSLVPGEEKEYLSCDSISKCTDAVEDADLLYPIEFLNAITANNFPQHRILLKKGVPIMLLRNLSQTEGLCNGTRLIVTHLADHVIEAVIITGMNIGDTVYIPRIVLSTTSSRMSESKLKDLALRGRNGTVCARVSRMWDYRGGTDDGDILHVDLVLVDSEGSAMYAEIGADDVEDKKPLLTEGKAYIFQRFMVANAKSTFRPVESKYMIKITCHTLIKEVENPLPPIPLHVYKLTKFADLPGFIGENKRFLDVLGLITEVSELEVVNFVSPRPSTVRWAITLRDASNYQMKVLLWGQRAREFEIDDIYALGQEEPVAVLFVGTLMKCYSREDSLSGNAACRWYINPDIPETNHLLESLHGGFDPIQRVVLEGHARAQQVPVVQPQPITIDRIPTSPYDFPVEVNEEQFWWFPSCNRCGKTSYPDGSGYKCLDCGCLTIKYKDGTSTPPLNLAVESPSLKRSTADSLGDDHTDKSVRKCLFSPADSVDLNTKGPPMSPIPNMALAAADKTLTDRYCKARPKWISGYSAEKICPDQERKENLECEKKTVCSCFC
ncbi:hypothetical protein ACP70R_000185 [Stipagrostis hirtigluma subsp. patula]